MVIQEDVENLIARILLLKPKIENRESNESWRNVGNVYTMFYNHPDRPTFAVLEGLVESLELEIKEKEGETNGQ